MPIANALKSDWSKNLSFGKELAPPQWLSGEHVGLMTRWL